MAKRRKGRTTKTESPTSDCVLLCDDVLVSTGKDKHNLVGIIGTIAVAGFPAVIGGYVTYARFRNVYQGKKVTLKFSSASTDESLFELEIPFPPQSNPLGVYTIVLPIPQFVAKEAGNYLFGAYDDGIPIAVSPISLVGFGGQS
jgi:hypothetical protein